MGTKGSQPASLEEDVSSTQLLELYKQMLENIRFEASGVWERFNILIGINFGLLGIVAFVFSIDPRPQLWKEMQVGLARTMEGSSHCNRGAVW